MSTESISISIPTNVAHWIVQINIKEVMNGLRTIINNNTASIKEKDIQDIIRQSAISSNNDNFSTDLVANIVLDTYTGVINKFGPLLVSDKLACLLGLTKDVLMQISISSEQERSKFEKIVRDKIIEWTLIGEEELAQFLEGNIAHIADFEKEQHSSNSISNSNSINELNNSSVGNVSKNKKDSARNKISKNEKENVRKEKEKESVVVVNEKKEKVKKMVFSVDELALVTEWILSEFIQHFELYRFVFGHARPRKTEIIVNKLIEMTDPEDFSLFLPENEFLERKEKRKKEKEEEIQRLEKERMERMEIIEKERVEREKREKEELEKRSIQLKLTEKNLVEVAEFLKIEIGKDYQQFAERLVLLKEKIDEFVSGNNMNNKEQQQTNSESIQVPQGAIFSFRSTSLSANC